MQRIFTNPPVDPVGSVSKHNPAGTFAVCLYWYEIAGVQMLAAVVGPPFAALIVEDSRVLHSRKTNR